MEFLVSQHIPSLPGVDQIDLYLVRICLVCDIAFLLLPGRLDNIPFLLSLSKKDHSLFLVYSFYNLFMKSG